MADDVDEDQDARDIEWSRLTNLIERGPYEQVAFVERIDSSELPEVISALANANGGVVVIGYKHTGDAPKVSITNLPEVEKYLPGVTLEGLDKFAFEWRSLFRAPLPSLRFSKFEIRPGSRMVYIDVQASPEPVRLIDGRGFRRKHTKNVQTFDTSRNTDEKGNAKTDDSDQGDNNLKPPDTKDLAQSSHDQQRRSDVEAAHRSEEEEASDERSKDIPIGDGIDCGRIPHDREICLNADKYADALATLFSSQSGELCFGILGHWGRGKSFLASLVAKRLESSGSYKVVHFSAWRYRATPELWVYLYESIRESIGGWFASVPIAIRAHIQRSGPWALLWTLGLFGFSLIGPVTKLVLLQRFAQILGIGGLLYLARQTISFRSSSIGMAMNLPGHRDKLGLQASIGDDLKALLIGWIPNSYFIDKYGLRSCCFWIAAYVGLVLLTLYQLGRRVFDITNNWFYGVGDTDVWTIALAFAGIAVFTAVTLGLLAASFIKSNCKRILLVIDDIDRCREDQILDVIESVILQLSDHEINKRLQICILAEGAVLEHAVLSRYAHLLRREGQTDTKVVETKRTPHPDQIICETFEKLFSAHLLLPPIGQLEFVELFDKHLVAARSPDSQRDPLPHQQFEKSWETFSSKRQESIAAMSEEEFRSLPTDVRESWIKLVTESTMFSQHEEEVLSRAARSLLTSSYPGIWGPRSIRMFRIRYQLARLLLNQLRIQWSPEELVQCLATCKPDGMDVRTSNPQVAAIVTQVTAWRSPTKSENSHD